MRYIGSFHGVTDLIVLIALAITIPIMISVNLFFCLSSYLILGIVLFFYMKNMYKVEIDGTALTQIYLISKKKKEFRLTHSTIGKAFFGFPSTKGLPIIKIYFTTPVEIIKITCSDRLELKKFYQFFTENNIKCEIFPERSKEELM
jgi:hypothetical protein